MLFLYQLIVVLFGLTLNKAKEPWNKNVWIIFEAMKKILQKKENYLENVLISHRNIRPHNL